MNIIEQNLFTAETLDQAITLITPPNLNVEQTISFKESVRNNLNTEKILFRANSFLVQYAAPAYFTFFLYYLQLSGEDPSILTIDNGTILVSRDINSGKFSGTINKEQIDNLTYEFVASSWLVLNEIKNPKLKNAMDKWSTSRKEIIGDKYFIQLLPANTTFHLDELYRQICAYS